jgi:hypothetical protein
MDVGLPIGPGCEAVFARNHQLRVVQRYGLHTRPQPADGGVRRGNPPNSLSVVSPNASQERAGTLALLFEIEWSLWWRFD